jgi:tetratricopeptide (TPR) repeat protein
MEGRAMGETIDAAAEVGHTALETLPDTSEKYRIRSDLYGMMIRTNYQGKKYEKRMSAAKDRALELDPDNPDAQVTGCKKLLFAKKRRGGDVLAALAHLDRAIELDASHVMAHVLRGIAREKLKDYDAAKADWNRALELNPRCKPAKDNLLRLVDEGH